MKSTSLNDFFERLESIERSKEDYVVPSTKMFMSDPETIGIDGLKGFSLNEVAHGQLADKLDIPRKYYNKISGYDGLREQNVNTLLSTAKSKYTIRTIENTARAVLSDKYLPVDNYLVMKEVLPVFKKFPEIQIKTSVLTDRKMYLQAFFPHTQKDIVPGDAVQYGITLTNSEVGLGAVRVESTVHRLVCSNGMIGKSIVNKNHVGRRIEESENMDLFRRETIQADLKAFCMKLTDLIEYNLDMAQVEALYAPLREAAGMMVVNPEETVQKITKRFDLREMEAQHVLRNMFKEDNISKYGIINGITNASHITENPDRQYELERIGNAVLDLPRSQWEVLSA